MQLKKSKSAAEDELLRRINEGHKVLRTIDEEYYRNMGTIHLWSLYLREWRQTVSDSLTAIFPDRLEADTFENTAEPFPYGLYEGNRDMAHSKAESLINKSIQVLAECKDIRLGRYADTVPQENKQEPLPELLVRHEIPNRVQMQNIDVLLVTATEVETGAILRLFPDARLSHIGDQAYHNLGSIEKAKIFMVQSEMGSGGQGGSILTIQEAIDALHPTTIVMVGIAFGIDQSKYQIGDILVSKQIVGYELQRVSTSPQNERVVRLRGDRPSASPRMLNIFRAATHYWQESSEVKFGLLLSGDKLIDNPDFRDQLLRLEPEAIGGEMEGAGLYAAAQRKKVDWILVKAICDWADGNKNQDKKRHQQLAAENAARFTVHVLKQGGFGQKEQELAKTSLSDAVNNEKPKPKSADQHIADSKRRLELAQKRGSEQGNNDHTIQEISNSTINAIKKSLM